MSTKLSEDLAKEKAFMKAASELLESTSDKEYFKKQKQGFIRAEPLANTLEKKELLLNQYVVARHQIFFLLYRKHLVTDKVVDGFFALPTLEEANARYADISKIRAGRQDEMQERMKELAEEEKDLDIFRAVLSGYSKNEEEAKQMQAESEKKQAEAMGA